MTYMYFDKTTGVPVPIFSYELELPTETQLDANKAFVKIYEYDPVSAEHIQIKEIEPQLADADW